MRTWTSPWPTLLLCCLVKAAAVEKKVKQLTDAKAPFERVVVSKEEAATMREIQERRQRDNELRAGHARVCFQHDSYSGHPGLRVRRFAWSSSTVRLADQICLTRLTVCSRVCFPPHANRAPLSG